MKDYLKPEESTDPVRKRKEVLGQLKSQDEKIHPVQKFMDNIWLLLALGLAIPLVSYTLWGIIELLSISEGLLP